MSIIQVTGLTVIFIIAAIRLCVLFRDYAASKRRHGEDLQYTTDINEYCDALDVWAKTATPEQIEKARSDLADSRDARPQTKA